MLLVSECSVDLLRALDWKAFPVFFRLVQGGDWVGNSMRLFALSFWGSLINFVNISSAETVLLLLLF